MTCNYSGAFGCNITSVAACTFHVNNLSVYNTPVADETNTAVLVREASTGLIKTRTLPATATYGLFVQTADGTTVTNTDTETTIIGSGVGSLAVPANGFKVGDSFQASFDGLISCLNSSTIHIHVRTTGGVLLMDTGVIDLDVTTAQSWILTLYFTVRALGAAGTASISSGGLFSYIKNGGQVYQGTVLSQVNNTTFDTTIINTLDVSVLWDSATTSNSIFSRNFTLNKIY